VEDVEEVEDIEDCPYPPEEYEPSVESSFSGFMLWINCSTGIVRGGGEGGLTPVTSAPGVVMGILEFGGRNFSGKFN
jgi:hypothetical protein